MKVLNYPWSKIIETCKHNIRDNKLGNVLTFLLLLTFLPIALQKEGLHGQRTKFKSHEVGMQVSCRVDNEMSAENVVGKLHQDLGDLLKYLARQQGCEILEGHLRPDHVHILISIPPKVSVDNVIVYIKGKSAIAIARTYVGRRKNFAGQSFGPEDTISTQ
jgi:hypothetical protein